MRVAVKVGYDGRKFHGSQVQPGNVRTVHSAVAQALREMGHDEPHLLWAGRTDAGVSAVGNVVAFETHVAPASLLPGLSFRLDDAWAWAWAKVDDAFEPRRARQRTYRYFLRTSLDAGAIGEALRVFEGTHDFSAFAKLEPGVEPTRTVLATSARREDAFVVIDIVGESFLWNQVRRMVGAAERVADGRASPRDIKDALATAARGDFGTAPPEPLILLGVDYPGLAFHEDRARVAQRFDARIADAELHLRTLRAVRGE